MGPGFTGHRVTSRAFGPHLVESAEPLEVSGRVGIDLRGYILWGKLWKKSPGATTGRKDGCKFQSWTPKQALLKLCCTDAMVKMTEVLWNTKQLTKVLEDRGWSYLG